MIKHNLSFKILMVYLIVFYPLVYQIFLNDSFVSLINQLILFSLLSLTILTYSNRIIAYIYAVKLNTSIIFLWTIFYLTISLLFFSSLNSNINVPSILREFLYSIIPILFYFIGKILNFKEKKIFFKYLFFSLSIVIIIGFIYRLGLYLPELLMTVFEQRTFRFNFSSFYRPIGMAFLAQFMFALLLFKKIKFKYRYLLLISFFVVSILTLQRAAFLGLIISLSIYLFKRLSFLKLTMVTFVILLGSLTLYEVIDKNSSTKTESKLFSSKLLLNEIQNFSLSSVQSDRASQAVVTNKTNILNMLIGEGFGKYSPNNDLALLIMPDASYFRIYNELGLIGFFLFFTPFILLLYEAVKIKDAFMIYFISFSLIAFFFNRVLWAIPINYLFYTSLGIFSNFNKLTNEEE